MANTKKLFLLDAFALIYRAHFALSKNPRVNSKGFNTGAIFGFLNSMLEIITKEKPTHLAVAFDTPEPTFRHIEFKEYKAQRDAQPEEISASLPYIFAILEAWNIPILRKPGFEADDVIGTIAKKAAKQGFDVYMMTLDKDYCQLVDENVYLFKVSSFGGGHTVMDVQAVLEKWNVKRIDQVADVLGLWGDASDNIPGIPGIGEKTAQKLLAEYDTVEGIVANADKLKGKQKENVINFGEQGILSKRLATIITDVDVDFIEDELIYQVPQPERLLPLLDELEFRNFKKRIFGLEDQKKDTSGGGVQTSLFDIPVESPALTLSEDLIMAEPAEKKTITNSVHHYHLVDNEEDIDALIEYLSIQKEFCFDTETTSLEALDAELVGIAFSYTEGEAYYVACPEAFEETKAIVQKFKSVLESATITKVGQNIKYDLLVLQKYDVLVQGPIFDTMLAHYIIEPDMRHNMDILAETYLNYIPVSITELIGKKGKNQMNMRDIPVADVVEYAGEDADITLRLKVIFENIIKERGQEELLQKVETNLVPVLADMETTGVRIDVEALNEFSTTLGDKIVEIEKLIFEQAGEEFNIASPKQLGVILFEKLGLDDKAKKTKTGQYATGEEVLARLESKHEIIKNILDYRELNKLKSTYVDTLPSMVSSRDNRIHTSYNQSVASTGRLSSVNPNLQNIPIRTELGREIRKAFVSADDDHVLFSADYSQIELRIMAAFSQDETMINAFKNGVDIHSTTASKVFGVALEDVTREQRSRAKVVNFGIIYGISAFGLSQRINIKRTEAQEIIDAYFEQFPSIKTYMDKCVNDAREKEYSETITGRRRYLKEINSRNQTQRGFAERNAINAPIQGSAADIIKLAMVNIHHWMKEQNLKSKMILQVHDELVFDVYKPELALLETKIPEFMNTALEIGVPLEVGIGSGTNWLVAH